MTSKQIIRNINISILTNSQLKEPYISIYIELKEVFSDLYVYTTYEGGYSEVYGKSKTDLYIINRIGREEIWLDTANIWSKFENKYSLSDECIQGITTWYLINNFKINGITCQGAKMRRWVIKKLNKIA